jgi:hypothetical protein
MSVGLLRRNHAHVAAHSEDSAHSARCTSETNEPGESWARNMLKTARTLNALRFVLRTPKAGERRRFGLLRVTVRAGRRPASEPVQVGTESRARVP